MEWLIWGFGLLAALVAGIILFAAWVVFRRDRNVANRGIKLVKSRRIERSNPTRGVPKSR